MSLPKKPETVTELLTSLPARIFRRDALLVVVALAAGAGAAVWAQSKAKDTIDGGVAPLQRAFDAHVTESRDVHSGERQAVQQLQADIADIRRQAAAKEERDAARFELLYRTILTRQPQPEAAELAAPARDGGR